MNLMIKYWPSAVKTDVLLKYLFNNSLIFFKFPSRKMLSFLYKSVFELHFVTRCVCFYLHHSNLVWAHWKSLCWGRWGLRASFVTSQIVWKVNLLQHSHKSKPKTLKHTEIRETSCVPVTAVTWHNISVRTSKGWLEAFHKHTHTSSVQ